MLLADVPPDDGGVDLAVVAVIVIAVAVLAIVLLLLRSNRPRR